MNFKQQFDKHAEHIGLKVNEYFASVLKEDGKTMHASFSVSTSNKPTIVVEYFVGDKAASKRGRFKIPLDSFLTLTSNDIDELKAMLIERSEHYDKLVEAMKVYPSTVKDDMQNMFRNC